MFLGGLGAEGMMRGEDEAKDIWTVRHERYLSEGAQAAITQRYWDIQRLIEKKKFGNALALLAKHEEEFPGHWSVWALALNTYKKMGDSDNAKKAALALMTSSYTADGLNSLRFIEPALFFHEEGDTEFAVEILRFGWSYLDRVGESDWTLLDLEVRILLESGNSTNALRRVKTISDGYPIRPGGVHDVKIRLLRRLAEEEGREEYLERAREIERVISEYEEEDRRLREEFRDSWMRSAEEVERTRMEESEN